MVRLEPFAQADLFFWVSCFVDAVCSSPRGEGGVPTDGDLQSLQAVCKEQHPHPAQQDQY